MKKKILELLEHNSRISPKEIAVMLGLPVQEVSRAMEEMEEERIILSYSTLIDWEKAGVEEVAALIEVKATPEQDVGYDHLARRICSYPEVKSLFLLSGTYDFAVLVVGKSLKEVANFVAHKLAPLEQVQSTVTHFILKKYKDSGIVFFEEQGSDKRQVLQP
ncbi:MAG TPA: Lrp/AsnC family transcriptional regulator [Moorella mulderi]|nr:Lrp/AsnC family transcriptional regulator [Moorella mulderi]